MSSDGAYYTYDGLGRREVRYSGTNIWFNQSGQVLGGTLNAGTTLANEYVYFNGMRVAVNVPTNTIYYYFGDQIGNLRTVTDASGNVCYNGDYTPLGWRDNYLYSCMQAFGFAGMNFEAEIPSYNTMFREYSPGQGRWLSPDPSPGDITNPQSLNRYAYVLNNPMGMTDPLGLCGEPDEDDPNNPGSVIGHPPCDFPHYDFYYLQDDSKALLDLLRKIGSRSIQAYCSATPSGRTTSLSVASGGVGAVSGEIDTVVNYNSGQTSVFATGGFSFGWNGGLSLTSTSGLIYGLDETNNGFSGRFNGGSFYGPTPIPDVGAGGSITNGGGVTVLSGGLSAAIFGRYGFGVSATNTTSPVNTGTFAGFSPFDYLGYLLRRPC
jgi:RHS repeat-associated protein